MKKCNSCLNDLPLSEFYPHPTSADRLQSKCKGCAKAYKKTWSGTDSGKVSNLKHALAYMSTPKGAEVARAATRKYKVVHAEKHRAHTAVRTAVRDGLLIKGPCEICGESKVEGHHDDYDKPLVVRWLCKRHHIEVHKQLREKV